MSMEFEPCTDEYLTMLCGNTSTGKPLWKSWPICNTSLPA